MQPNKILTVETPDEILIVAIPAESREGAFPNGSKYLLVPAPEADGEFADDEGMLAIDSEWLPDFARNGWAGLKLLETRPKVASDTMPAS